MDTGLLLNIGFGIVTLLSFIYAIRENKEKTRAINAEKKWKDLYKTTCQGKCITIAGIARDLAQNTTNSCKMVKRCEDYVKRENISNGCDQIVRLSSYIYSTRTSTNSLIDFCEVIKKEYENNFNEPILENFNTKVPRILCDEDVDGKFSVKHT